MSKEHDRWRPLSEMSRDDLEAHAERLQGAVERLSVFVPKPSEPVGVDRDTAMQAVRHLVLRLAPGADVDFYAPPGAAGLEAVHVSHPDSHMRRVLSEIAASVLDQVGYPVQKSNTPASELVSLRERARQKWLDESAEGRSQELFHDAFRGMRGAIDPDIDLET